MLGIIRGIVLSLLLLQTARPQLEGIWLSDGDRNQYAIATGQVPQYFEKTITITESKVSIVDHVKNSNGSDLTGLPRSAQAVTTTECSFAATPAENPGRMFTLLCSAKWQENSLLLMLRRKDDEKSAWALSEYRLVDGALQVHHQGVNPDGKPTVLNVFLNRKK
jgi:hypothetical protein